MKFSKEEEPDKQSAQIKLQHMTSLNILPSWHSLPRHEDVMNPTAATVQLMEITKIGGCMRDCSV